MITSSFKFFYQLNCNFNPSFFIMDKRSVFFVICLSLSWLMITRYFESENDKNLQVRIEQQKAKKEQQIKQLEKEIVQNTANVNELPLVELFLDAEGAKPFARGVLFDQSVDQRIVTIAGHELPPKTLFVKKEGSLQEVNLISRNSLASQPAIYAASALSASVETFSIPHLPEFGSYYLQLVDVTAENPLTLLGELNDGHLTIPAQKLETLQRQLQIPPTQQTKIGDSLALVKTADGFSPAAFFDSKTQTVIALNKISNLSSLITQKDQKKAITSTQKVEEQYFVLETPYQQLVFSNYGGALVELNLPFKGKLSPDSVVREIAYDREMVEERPYNARFPAHPYFTPGADPKNSYVENAQGKLGGYYPLLRRDLIQNSLGKSIHVPPRYYALNIVSDYPEVAELVYDVKHFDQNSITFESTQPHRRITKTYSVKSETEGAPYTLDVAIKVEGDNRGLWITTGVPEVEWISGAPAPALKYRITRNNKPEVVLIDPPKDTTTVSSIYPDWVVTSNGFFGLILDPLTQIDPGFRAQYVPGTLVPSRLVELGSENQRFKPQDLPGYTLLMPLKSNSSQAMNFRVFAGPFSSDSATGYNPDYIASQTFHGWFTFISEPFAHFLFILMKFFYSVTHSWAFSIVLLTVALRIMMYPLNAWSNKSMLKMQQIAPQVAAIQEKNKKDPKKAQLEIMNLYREKGVNPVSGCLPLLIQMPFLIGMFDLLKSTFELRGASFIPGWIDDLTAPDVLFSWHTPIFFIGNQFHLLPILLGLVMFWQQRFFSTAPKDVSQMTDQERQQKAMSTLMPIIFAVMFYHFPSGLNIYWLSSMLLGILQQWWTAKSMKPKAVT
jgi:YidC/Oxa1 family membrane protein insertase